MYSFNKKSTLNKVFLLALLTTFLYSFSTVMMWSSSNPSAAYFWNKVGTVWPFFVATVFNFALIYTENKWLKSKRNYLVLYLPAVAFFLTDLFTNLINGPPVLRFWGYNDVATGTWVYYAATVWSVLLPILSFTLSLRYYLKTTDAGQKIRRRFVCIGFAIPCVAFLTTNVIARSLGIPFPNLGIIATMFFSAFVGYGIFTADLFTFDAAMAAEKILSTMPDALFLADVNGKILSVNRQLVDFFGYPEEKLVGQPISKLCCKDDEKDYKGIFDKLMTDGTVKNRELTVMTSAGSKKWVLFSGSAVITRTSRIVGSVYIIHDITERKQMEEKLVKSERLASIGELAGQIGHDLRNPLAAIKNGTYILDKRSNRFSEERKKEILSTIDKAVEDANRIVTTLIDYSSELYLQISECTPKSLVQNALSNTIVPARIGIQNEVVDDEKMFLDALKVESALSSILKNAVEAISDSGTIRLSSLHRNGNIELFIADSGSGIPQTALIKLFSPLVTTKAKGMGMSLAICKRVVEAHGGKINVQTAEGAGSTFTVTLPIQSSKEAYSPEPTFYVDSVSSRPLMGQNAYKAQSHDSQS